MPSLGVLSLSLVSNFLFLGFPELFPPPFVIKLCLSRTELERFAWCNVSDATHPFVPSLFSFGLLWILRSSEWSLCATAQLLLHISPSLSLNVIYLSVRWSTLGDHSGRSSKTNFSIMLLKRLILILLSLLHFFSVSTLCALQRFIDLLDFLTCAVFSYLVIPTAVIPGIFLALSTSNNNNICPEPMGPVPEESGFSNWLVVVYHPGVVFSKCVLSIASIFGFRVVYLPLLPGVWE